MYNMMQQTYFSKLQAVGREVCENGSQFDPKHLNPSRREELREKSVRPFLNYWASGDGSKSCVDPNGPNAS